MDALVRRHSGGYHIPFAKALQHLGSLLGGICTSLGSCHIDECAVCGCLGDVSKLIWRDRLRMLCNAVRHGKAAEQSGLALHGINDTLRSGNYYGALGHLL